MNPSQLIEHVRYRLLASGMATTNQLVGCNEAELQELDALAKGPLPTIYRAFMAAFGRGAGRFWRELDTFYPDVLDLKESAEEIVADDETPDLVLPETAFVFAMRRGEQFLFFDTLEENPPIKFFYWDHSEFQIVANSYQELLLRELTAAETTYASIRGTPYDLG